MPSSGRYFAYAYCGIIRLSARRENGVSWRRSPSAPGPVHKVRERNDLRCRPGGCEPADLQQGREIDLWVGRTAPAAAGPRFGNGKSSSQGAFALQDARLALCPRLRFVWTKLTDIIGGCCGGFGSRNGGGGDVASQDTHPSGGFVDRLGTGLVSGRDSAGPCPAGWRAWRWARGRGRRARRPDTRAGCLARRRWPRGRQFLTWRKQPFTWRERHLTWRKRLLSRRERHLAWRKRHLARWKRHLTWRERHLAWREQHLAWREQYLAWWEQYLAWRKRLRSRRRSTRWQRCSCPATVRSSPEPAESRRRTTSQVEFLLFLSLSLRLRLFRSRLEPLLRPAVLPLL